MQLLWERGPATRRHIATAANSYKRSAAKGLLDGQSQASGDVRTENCSIRAAVHQKMFVDGPSCYSRHLSAHDRARYAVRT
jgi:hypothetical protein